MKVPDVSAQFTDMFTSLGNTFISTILFNQEYVSPGRQAQKKRRNFGLEHLWRYFSVKIASIPAFITHNKVHSKSARKKKRNLHASTHISLSEHSKQTTKL